MGPLLLLVAVAVLGIGRAQGPERLNSGTSGGLPGGDDGDRPFVMHNPPGMALPGESLSVTFLPTCPPPDRAARRAGCPDGALQVTYSINGGRTASAPLRLDPDGTYAATLPPFEGTLTYRAVLRTPTSPAVESSWTAITASPPRDITIDGDALSAAPERGRPSFAAPWSRHTVEVDYAAGSTPIPPPATDRLASNEVIVPDPATDDLVVFDGASASVARRFRSPVTVDRIADLRAVPGRPDLVAVLSQAGRGAVRLHVVDVRTGAERTATGVPGETAGRLVQLEGGLAVLTYPGPVTRVLELQDDGRVRFGEETQDLALEQGSASAGMRVRISPREARYCLRSGGLTKWCVRATSPWAFGDLALVGQLRDGAVVVVQRLYDDSVDAQPTRYVAVVLDNGSVRSIRALDARDDLDLPVGGRFRFDGVELQQLTPTHQQLSTHAFTIGGT